MSGQKEENEKRSFGQVNHLTEQLERTRGELEEIQKEFDKLYIAHSEAEHRLQQEILKSHSAEQICAQLQEHERTRIREMEQLHEQLDQFAKISSDAEAEKENIMYEKESLSETVQQMNEKIVQLTRDLQLVEEEKKRNETEHREKLSKTLEEMQQSFGARDQLQGEITRLQQTIDGMSESINALEREKSELEEKNEKIENTKLLMQKTLMGQINTLREKQKSLESEGELQAQHKDKIEKELAKLQVRCRSPAITNFHSSFSNLLDKRVLYHSHFKVQNC